MTALLTDNLPLLAGAPNGIKKLRELILELAVRGKLVPQEPSDEPASELLKRIAEEKARLVAEGKIKKQKPLAGIGEEEKPFELPEGWEWSRLSDLLPEFQNGASSRGDSDGLPVTVLRLADIKAGEISLDDTRTLMLSATTISKYALEDSDILLIRVNGSADLVGRFVVCRTTLQAIPCDHFIRMRFPRDVIDSAYLKLIGDSEIARSAIAGLFVSTAGQKTVNQGHIGSLLLPLPPLAEQHRIVAKVDELMALCDRLETRQADAASAHARLVQALLDSLTQASDAADFAASWQRLAGHFHSLFTSESSIDALKQTLLQLAVMGKLVPQAPSDEPASELLKRIAEEKARLVKEEGLRTTARDDVPEDEYYLELPRGWAYCRLGNLARFIDYRGKTPTKTKTGVPLITAKNVRPGFISREPQEFIAERDYETWMTRGFPRIGDMLFTTEAPMGNIALIDISEKFALAQRVICFQLHEPRLGAFLKLAIMSSIFQKQLWEASTGMTATGIKASRLKEIPAPLPPLAEQHRIVAKLDQLMTLCDQLKTRLTTARQLHERLAGALVEQAVA
ncbi:restriction endonuclease subunit S [Azotobacter chroococcum]|uniref:restriction endonuclease subunit S n=1 Tax=Azotobacter chroococcum TaxID=353 RepID=UPI0010387EFB|nr:restriction endonuclease subunit S [Azotobacter chroococcum]TBW38127.1 restriction endonuclease subunit S [Azotobacter chroococcum]